MVWDCVGTNCTRSHAPDVSTLYHLWTSAKFTYETMPVLSVYLNTQWCDQHQRERVTTFLERHLRPAQVLEPETPEALESLT